MQRSANNQTVPDNAADACMTAKVKAEFGTTNGVHATDVSIRTDEA